MLHNRPSAQAFAAIIIDNHGTTALHQAAQEGTLKDLCGVTAEFLATVKSNHGWTPLHTAEDDTVSNRYGITAKLCASQTKASTQLHQTLPGKAVPALRAAAGPSPNSINAKFRVWQTRSCAPVVRGLRKVGIAPPSQKAVFIRPVTLYGHICANSCSDSTYSYTYGTLPLTKTRRNRNRKSRSDTTNHKLNTIHERGNESIAA